MGSNTLWGWLIWTSVAQLFIPAVIYTIKLEIDDLRSERVQKGPQTREEVIESEHRTAA